MCIGSNDGFPYSMVSPHSAMHADTIGHAREVGFPSRGRSKRGMRHRVRARGDTGLFVGAAYVD